MDKCDDLLTLTIGKQKSIALIAHDSKKAEYDHKIINFNKNIKLRAEML